jgi:hypothetical protein
MFSGGLMELLNALEHKDLIEKIISLRGHATEHHYYNYLYNCDIGEVPVFFKISNSEGILAFYYSKGSTYRIFSELLVDRVDRVKYIEAFLDKVRSLEAKKVEIETDMELRSELIAHFKPIHEYSIGKINLTFTWPVFDMDNWNGELMQGKDWKDIRYYWNKYFKDHKVEFKTAEEVDSKVMKDLVLEWKKQRTGKRVTFYKYYLNAIDDGFKGFDTRIMLVDGRVMAITAGFKVPNSREYYYSAIGIYSRDIPRTGEICNMDDLINLKKQGYRSVDFGGGEESLVEFKQKFRPTRSYQTHLYSILLRNRSQDSKVDAIDGINTKIL